MMTTAELMYEVAKYGINFDIYYDCNSKTDAIRDPYLGCEKYLRIFFRDKIAIEVSIDRENVWHSNKPALNRLDLYLWLTLIDLVRIYARTPLSERGEVEEKEAEE